MYERAWVCCEYNTAIISSSNGNSSERYARSTIDGCPMNERFLVLLYEQQAVRILLCNRRWHVIVALLDGCHAIIAPPVSTSCVEA